MAEQAVLVGKEGPLAGTRVEVETEVVVGREAAALTIEDAEISRRHAALRLRGEILELEDLGSLNGTFVNGQRIEEATILKAGDIVKLGRTTLEVESVPRTSRTVLSAPAPAAGATVQQLQPAPRPPAAPPQPAPALAPAQADVGAFAPAAPKRRRGSATRRLTPTLLSFSAIAATAVALVVYFAPH
jgi:pSer/pThr/pTyr-binding forkhead associated (FHA) protein